nr:hypothetical protein [uncultured Pseudomonas sp.]
MNTQWKLVPVEPTQSILDAMTTERKKGNGVLQMWFEAMAAAPAPPEAHEQPACDHEWTDDGGFLLVCTNCGAQEDHDPKWQDMESAPRDGTLLRLLVSFDEHSTEDADESPTIGANNFDNDEEDVWRFAGWCWTHDHFTQGVGTPMGWLPMIDAGTCTGEIERLTAERDALQLLLNDRDEQLHTLEQSRRSHFENAQAAERRIDDLLAEIAKVRKGPCKMIVGDEMP